MEHQYKTSESHRVCVANYHRRRQETDPEYREYNNNRVKAWYQQNRERAIASAIVRVNKRRALLKAAKEAAKNTEAK
jgi:hypothetical protein